MCSPLSAFKPFIELMLSSELDNKRSVHFYNSAKTADPAPRTLREDDNDNVDEATT